jgi:hypothetical protein
VVYMIKSLLLLFLGLSLSGCQSIGAEYYELVKQAYAGQKDIVLTNQEIQQRKRPSIYLKLGDVNPQVVATLAVIENNQSKWVTADRNVIVTQNGRLVRIVGIDRSPTYISNLESDPVQNGVDFVTDKKRWQRFIDFKMQNQVLTNYRVDAMYKKEAMQYRFLGGNRSVIKLVETNSAYDLDMEYSNILIFDEQSKELLFTRQYIAPGIGWLEMTFIN